jgi:transcription initiation factor TFIIH subunit 1
MIIDTAKSNVRNWNENLLQMKLEREAGGAALLSMTTNVSARLDVRSRRSQFFE